MNKKILFIFIILIAAVLRFYQLGSVPPSPDWDEVALGYNAHSLFTTGRDEFGTFMPIVLRSFDDYKPAVYAYLAIPFVEIFGLNTFAVRLPSALMGILAVIATYFLVKELFRNQKRPFDSTWIALLAAFSLAISPWHIQFSRVGFETNVGVTFNILAALFFIKGLKRPWLLLLSTFFAGINLSVYQSERVFTPLLFITLVLIFRKELFALSKKYLVSAVVVGLIAVMPLALFIMQDQNALARAKNTSVFSNQDILKTSIVRLQRDQENNDLFGAVFDNRRTVYASSIVAAYISHFDLNWLFIRGDIARHHAPGMGLLYLVLLPVILIGIYQLIFGPFPRKTKYLIFAWFLLAPVPAAVTTGVPHAVRTMNFLPMYDIFIALGAIIAALSIARWKIRYIVFGACILAFSFNFFYYLNQYFVQQNYFHASEWQYGYAEAVPQLEQLKKNYKKVIVSDVDGLDKSYMFFLFYLKFPPQEYQKLSRSAFDTYEFHRIDWNKEKENKDYLFVGSIKDFPEKVVSKKVITFPDGKPAILIVDPKDNI